MLVGQSIDSTMLITLTFDCWFNRCVCKCNRTDFSFCFFYLWHHLRHSDTHSFPSFSSSSRSSSYHCLWAWPFPCEEVPEVSSRWRFALLLWRLPHPDAALSRPRQAGAAAAGTQGEAQRGTKRASPSVRGGGGRGGLCQTEQVVVGVELTHVADGFTGRDLTWRRNKAQDTVRICMWV